MSLKRHIELMVRRRYVSAEDDACDFWMKQSPEKRLAVVEEIRREYHLWRYGGEPPFERVACVISKNGKVIRHVGRK